MLKRRQLMNAALWSLPATALSAVATSGAWARGAPVRLAASEFPPYMSAALPGGGVSCQIAMEGFRAAGLDCLLEFRPWARAMSEFLAGQFDGLIATWWTPERAQQMAFSPELGVVNRFGFMARADRLRPVDDLARLKDLLIGTVNGYANPERFERAGLRQEKALDDLSNLRKLLIGRVDLALIDKGVAHHLLRTQLAAEARQLRWLEPEVGEYKQYVALHRAGEHRGMQMQAALTEGMARLRSSGALARLLRQGADWQV